MEEKQKKELPYWAWLLVKVIAGIVWAVAGPLLILMFMGGLIVAVPFAATIWVSYISQQAVTDMFSYYHARRKLKLVNEQK